MKRKGQDLKEPPAKRLEGDRNPSQSGSSSGSRQSSFSGTSHVQPDTQSPKMQNLMEAAERALTPEHQGRPDDPRGQQYKQRESERERRRKLLDDIIVETLDMPLSEQKSRFMEYVNRIPDDEKPNEMKFVKDTLGARLIEQREKTIEETAVEGMALDKQSKIWSEWIDTIHDDAKTDEMQFVFDTLKARRDEARHDGENDEYQSD